MEPPASLGSSLSKRPPLACIRCTERKVKCDKQDPCSTCVRHNEQCVFRPKPARRKRTYAADPLVYERLKHYETLLREHSIDPNQVSTASKAAYHSKHARIDVEPQATVFKPQLLHRQAGTKLVDNSLWSRVAEEIHTNEDAVEEGSSDDTSDDGMSNEDFTYVLGWKPRASAPSHPPAERIAQLWQIFLENVNPLSKLVHVPSLQPAMDKAIADIDHVPKGLEALMFAVYSMAVLSLTEHECEDSLGEERAFLLSRYVAATKAALSRAKFMSTTSIVVLQALTLHILSVRDTYEARAVWSLTGVAIRVAEGMGVSLDGTLLGLSPFETEIRRRIWWQLKMHDFRAAELSGQAKFREFKLDETTPKKPANVNDSDLYPAMPQAALESTKPTEMIWCMFRSDLASFAATQTANMHKQGMTGFTSDEYAAMDNLNIKDTFIKELEDMIETRYLRFCDPSQPLQFMVLITARCSANLVRFIAHHPRRWAHLDHVPLSEQQFVWDISIQILEQYNMMQSSPQLRRFAWNVPYFIQWHAVIHVLDTLRADPHRLDAAKAWQLIDALYMNNSELLLSSNKPILMAVGNLCLKAFNARIAAQTEGKRSFADPLTYITKLREQREAAKARRKAAAMRSKGQETVDRGWISMVVNPNTWPDTDVRATETLREAQPQHYLNALQPVNHIQENTATSGDTFRLNDAWVDEFFAARAEEMINIDTDAILAQEYSPDSGVIDWAQWDAWLGNRDSMRPTI